MSNQVIAPPLPVLDTAEFRRRLAGLSDPAAKGEPADKAAVRESAIHFCSILPRLFGDDLDRTTLWPRITTAVQTAAAKVQDGDLDQFSAFVLDHIQADAGVAASSKEFAAWLFLSNGQPEEWRQAFVALLGKTAIPLVVHARARWEDFKAAKGGVK